MNRTDLLSLVLAVAVLAAIFGSLIVWSIRADKADDRAVWQAVLNLDNSETEVIWGGSVFLHLQGRRISIEKVYSALDALVYKGKLERFSENEVRSSAPGRAMYCLPASRQWPATANPSQRIVLDLIIDRTVKDQVISTDAICENTGMSHGHVKRTLNHLIRQGWVVANSNTSTPTYRLVITPAE